jgi:phosphoribosylaminoimidazole carboxylase (NCAIR synthetase)
MSLPAANRPFIPLPWRAELSVHGLHQPPLRCVRCRDKLAMKEYLHKYNIPMTRFLAESSVNSPADAFHYLDSPLVRKQRKSFGGRSFELFTQEQDLVLQQNGRNILEKFVSAPQASIESFVNNGEIKFVNITITWKNVMSTWCLLRLMKTCRQTC